VTRRALRIGHVFGIEIDVDWTWFIVFFMFAALLSQGYFAEKLPGLGLPARLLVAAFTTALFFASVLLHELAHSVVAIRNGLGISGITLFIFGGVSRMEDEPRSPEMELKIAIAGPATSVGLCVLFLLLSRLAAVTSGGSTFRVVFFYLGWVNGMLAAFNLLPGFPLDGGRVLRAGLWRGLMNLTEATRIAAFLGEGLGILLIVLGTLSLFVFGRLSINGLWLAFIGWFLIQAAQSSYQQLVIRMALAGIPVAQIMTRQVDAVPGGVSLETVVHDYVMARNHPAFPVVDGETVFGLLCLDHIRAVPREQWAQETARQATPPLSAGDVVSPSADAWEALARMTAENCGRLLVMDGERLVGIVSRTDIMRAIHARMRLGL
jgi:Zn-dependent protease/predicted transcriptional regulator